MNGPHSAKDDFYVIGNPPYQDETIGENATFAPPIYHQFLDESYKVAHVVELIHPARFLFNAGNTPKAWNRKMLSDEHLKVLYYEEDSHKVFPTTEIKAGVVITYHDEDATFEPIKVFTKYMPLNAVLRRVQAANGFKSMKSKVVSRTAYRFTDKMHNDHPEAIGQLSNGHAYDVSTNVFDRVPQLFFDDKPNDGQDYIQILGRSGGGRAYKYVRKDYIVPIESLGMYKLLMSSANGSGVFGESLTMPVIAPPWTGATETFVSIGGFDTECEAEAARKYICTKFLRAMLGVLKVTQHVTPQKWEYVPLQDFTSSSDINWVQPVPDIDRQLYAKYGLSQDEVDFIESHVKEMQ